jgi:hypothetical protein
MGSQNSRLRRVCQLQIPGADAGCARLESRTEDLADFTVTDHSNVLKLHAHVSN